MGDKFDIHDGRGLTEDEIKLLFATMRAEIAKDITAVLAAAKDYANERDTHLKGNIMQHITQTGALTEMKVGFLEKTVHENLEKSVENGKKLDKVVVWQAVATGGLLVANIAMRYIHL